MTWRRQRGWVLGFATGLLWLTVSCTKTSPLAPTQPGDFAFRTKEDTPLTETILAEGRSSVRFAVKVGPKLGRVELDATTGEFTYTPAPDKNGADSFQYMVSSGDGAGSTVENEATVRIDIEPVNDPPRLSVRSISSQDQFGVFDTLSATDPEGDSISYEIVQGPSSGTVILLDPATGEFRFDPHSALDPETGDKFTVRLSDGKDQATETIEIKASTDVARAPSSDTDDSEGPQ